MWWCINYRARKKLSVNHFNQTFGVQKIDVIQSSYRIFPKLLVLKNFLSNLTYDLFKELWVNYLTLGEYYFNFLICLFHDCSTTKLYTVEKVFGKDLVMFPYKSSAKLLLASVLQNYTNLIPKRNFFLLNKWSVASGQILVFHRSLHKYSRTVNEKNALTVWIYFCSWSQTFLIEVIGIFL